MQSCDFSAKSWKELKALDERAYRAIWDYAQTLSEGPWTLTDFFDTDGGSHTFMVTLQSMRTNQRKTGLVTRSNGIYSFFGPDGG